MTRLRTRPAARFAPVLLLSACLPSFPARDFVEDPTGDSDGDGYTELDGDCDDASPSVYPGAPEVCDDRDNDCDGRSDEVEDADDGNFVVDAPVWYGDVDGDGYGTESYTLTACAQPLGYTDQKGDCDDGLGSVHPGAIEYCGGIDDDCDGAIDENNEDGSVAGEKDWFLDGDRDGYGDDTQVYTGCEPPSGFVYEGGDCDDTDRNAYPGATEVCDGVDNDCDGLTDDADPEGPNDPATWYRDADSDGWGTADDTMAACAPAAGYVADPGDCDDTTASTFPLAAETCNEVDDDCDALVDEDVQLDFYRDADGDGHGDPLVLLGACAAPSGYVADFTDCDDGDDAISPSAPELCATEGVDDDCDGTADEADAADVPTWYRDADGDTYGDTSSPLEQCTQPLNHVALDGDCDDARSGVHPGMTENCLTTHDDDCSGTTNDVGADACTTFYADVDGDGYGVAADTQCTCEADTSTVYTSQVTEDCDDGDAAVSPADVETCATAGVDDDCDGTADEEDATGCTNYFYDYDGDGYGVNDYRCLCAASGYYDALTLGDCDDADSTVSPAAANCGLNGVVSTDEASAVLSAGSNQMVPHAVDYDGDGTLDIAVGVPGNDGAYTSSGALYLWLGPVTGAHDASGSGDADLSFAADDLYGRQLGHWVSSGDVDGDGSQEILVSSASNPVTGGTDAYLIGGGLTGLGLLTPSSTGVETLSGDGMALLLGDLDGDGYDDAAVQVGTGYFNLVVHYGSAAGLDTTPSSDSISIEDRLERVDLDGDGVDELVDRYYGLAVRIWETGAGWGTQRSQGLGGSGSCGSECTVRGIGDVSGDGLGDVAFSRTNVGSPPDPYTGAFMRYAGRVYLFEGGSDATGSPALMGPVSAATSLSDAMLQIHGTAPSQGLGSDAASAGDVDADGYSDLLLSSNSTGTYSTGATSGTLWYGPVSTGGAVVSASAAGATFADGWNSVEAAGDTNADGYADFWMGARSLYLFHGTPN